MKCEFCGGDLSLEAEVCPHCGQLNKHAQQHIKDMKRYHGEFENTKKGVYSVAKKYTGVTVRCIIITVMVVLIVLLWLLYDNAYRIKRDILRNQASKKEEEYSEILDEYLAEEDYRGFLNFCEMNGISLYYEDGEFYQYRRLINATSRYFQVAIKVMELTVSREEANISYLCSNLSEFYDYLDAEKYSYYEDLNNEMVWQTLERLEENLKLTLRTYCNLTEEEADSLKELSDAKRTVLIEEKLLNDE